jgi:hypothetical protein
VSEGFEMYLLQALLSRCSSNLLHVLKCINSPTSPKGHRDMQPSVNWCRNEKGIYDFI